MKSFDMRIGVEYLNLKVKFACKISISMKYRGKEYSIVEEQTLINGSFTAPIKEITNLEADYNKKEDRFADNQSLTMILYLHSSHGKMLVGSFLYKLSQLKFKKTVVQKIKNSPDKNAEIKFSLQLIKNKNIKEAASDKDEELIAKYSPQRQLRITSLKNYNYQDLPINTPNSKKDNVEYQKLLRSLSGTSFLNPKVGNLSKIQQNPTSPKILFKSNANSPDFFPRHQNLIESKATKITSSKADNPNSVQLLKKKLSQVKQTAIEGNQKYLQRIAELQKELKQSKQRSSNLQLQLKLKESNSKYFQKDLAGKKDKVQQLELEIKELNKEIVNYEQKIRELQYNLKSLTEEHTELIHNHKGLTKKMEKREEYYGSLVQSLNQKYYEIEGQRQNALYKLASLETQLQESKKLFNNQIREKEKKYNEQRGASTKKISILQKTVQEKKNEILNWSQKFKNSQKQIQELRLMKQNSVTQATKLRSKIEQLSLLVGNQEMKKRALEQQLKEQKCISHQNKSLKEQLQSKNEELQTNINKIGKMEQEIAQLEEKIKQLTTNLQNLQEEYEKLYYENVGQSQQLERKKKLIAQLMQQNEQLQKNIEKINFTLKNQANQFDQQKTQMQQNFKNLKAQHEKMCQSLKDTKKQLFQESQSRRICQKQLLDAKKRMDDLQNEVQSLQSRNSHITQQLNKLRGSNILLTNRNENLTSQIEQIKKLRDEKQLKVARLTEQNQQTVRQRQEQVQSLQESIEKLNAEIKILHKQNEEMNDVVDSKKEQINQLRRQLTLKRNQQISLNETKMQLQRNNAQYRDKNIELHEHIEILQEKIAKYQQELQEVHATLFQQDIHSEGQSNGGVEAIKKKIADLYNEIKRKQNENQEKNAIISNLELQISHLKNQQSHLREVIEAKQEEIAKEKKNEEDLKKYLDENLTGLKNQLANKDTQMLAVSIFKFQSDMLNEEEHQSALSKYKQIIEDLNSKIAAIKNQKSNLDAVIEDKKAEIFKLDNQLSRYKKNQQRLNEQAKQLKSIIKDMKDEIQSLNDQKALLGVKINDLSGKNMELDRKVRENQQIINQLNMQTHKIQQIIEQQTLYRERQQQALSNLQDQLSQKTKDLVKKLDAAKHELTEKSKQLTQLESEKKNRIQVLSNHLDQLKKQNFDLQSIAYAQKSNNTKLSSIISELSSSINKIEKSNNIKTYYMIPIKDLIKKFEEIMEASDQMYVQFEKKKVKKQQKEKEKEKVAHIPQSQQQFIEI